MIDPETQDQITNFISDEARRVPFGKLLIEITMMNGHATNIQCETKRSYNLNRTAVNR